jgi:hypothetical protein
MTSSGSPTKTTSPAIARTLAELQRRRMTTPALMPRAHTAERLTDAWGSTISV